MTAELVVESCPHIRNNKMKPLTILHHTTNSEVSRAELNTETRLCAICSGLMAKVLINLEHHGEIEPEPGDFGSPDAHELQMITDEMRQLTELFYFLCMKAEFPAKVAPFVDFASLMREYIHGCSAITRDGQDFRRAAVRREPNVVLPVDIRFVAEKIDSIFGPSIRASSESREAFLRGLSLK